jgi:hypothetical protein
MQKFTFTFFILLGNLSLGLAQETPSPTKQDVTTILDAPQTELPVTRTINREIEKTIKGKKWVLKTTNGEVTEVKLSGKKLPKSNWAKYQAEIDELRASSIDTESEINLGEGKVIKASDIHISEGGALSPEQKAAQSALEDEMLRDKYIHERAYKMMLSDKIFILNGKTMPKDVHERYVNIYYTYSGETRCEGCRFKVEVDKQTK